MNHKLLFTPDQLHSGVVEVIPVGVALGCTQALLLTDAQLTGLDEALEQGDYVKARELLGLPEEDILW